MDEQKTKVQNDAKGADNYQPSAPENPDYMKLPIVQAAEWFAQMGAMAIDSVKQTAKNTFDAIEEEAYRSICRPILTLDDCVTWMKIQRPKYPNAGYLFIYAEENSSPRNENDMYSVAIALLDGNKRPLFVDEAVSNRTAFATPIRKNSSDIVCMVVPVKTLDLKLINALNGAPSVLVRL